jgi:hypothetical protein
MVVDLTEIEEGVVKMVKERRKEPREESWWSRPRIPLSRLSGVKLRRGSMSSWPKQGSTQPETIIRTAGGERRESEREEVGAEVTDNFRE